MAIGTFFYVTRNSSDGSVTVEFYADKETAELACEIEARSGNPQRNNKPQEIELEFDAMGKLLTPDATKQELRRQLTDLMLTPAPVVEQKKEPPAAVSKTFSEAAQPAPVPAQESLADKIPSVAGKVIAFTGKLSMSRPRIKEYAKALGARVAGSVTENTDILVVGQDAGIKLENARELGTIIITEEQWNELALRSEKRPKPAPGL